MTGIIKTDQLQGAQSSTIAVPSGNNLTVGGTLGITGTTTGTNITATGSISSTDGGTALTMGVLSNATSLPALNFNGAFASTTMAGIYGNGATASNLYYMVPSSQSHFFGIADSTKMTISSSGQVGIGVVTPEQPLHVRSSTFAYIRSESTNSTLTGFDIGQHQDGSGHLNLRDNHPVKISTNDTLRLRVDADGLKFGTDTAAANALDDYEEGTWTGTWYGSGGTNDSANANLKYVKIGKTVTVSGNTTGNINATGPLELRGLPFTAEDDATGAVLYRYTTAGSGQHTLVFYVGANQSKIEPYWAAGGNYDKLNSSDFNSSGRDMYFSITYKAQ